MKLSSRPIVVFFLFVFVNTVYSSDVTYMRYADYKVYTNFPEEMESIGLLALPKDETGLISLNYEWGGMYGPRFQMGAGRALRISLATGNIENSQQAFLAIKTGANAIEGDGYIPLGLPVGVGEALMTEGSIASGGAFYLGDACLGISSLLVDENIDDIALSTDVTDTVNSLSRGIIWLMGQIELLNEYDKFSPNRLFFDALAFQACGVLTDNDSALAEVTDYVDAALALFSEDGYFVENGGWDTSYQAVSIKVANDLTLAKFRSKKLGNTLLEATQWLASKVNPDGQVDSNGNTRTCGIVENFLGQPKTLSISSVLLSLMYTGTRFQDNAINDAANRVSNWLLLNPGADPCLT